MGSSGAARRAGSGGAASRGSAGVPDGFSGVVGAGPRLTGSGVRAARFARAAWRRGLDPDEVFGFLARVAEELDLRAREVAAALAEADRAIDELRRWRTRNARGGWSGSASGSARPAGGGVSDELAAHYREMMVAHSDDPSSGACPHCDQSRCGQWRWAYERLVVAGRLADLPTGPWAATDDGPNA